MIKPTLNLTSSVTKLKVLITQKHPQLVISLLLTSLIFIIAVFLFHLSSSKSSSLPPRTLINSSAPSTTPLPNPPDITAEFSTQVSSRGNPLITYDQRFTTTADRTQTLSIPTFSTGKIAFIYQHNLWVAMPSGTATNITGDATDQLTPTFPSHIHYLYPQWSPSGSKLYFIQDTVAGRRALLTDTQQISADSSFNLGPELLPYWISDDKLLVPHLAIFTSSIKGTKWAGSGDPNDPFFDQYYMSNGCGGGGYSPVLHLKITNIPATMIYISTTNQLIYPSGCGMNVSYITNPRSNTLAAFALTDSNNPDFPYITPNQLTISHNPTNPIIAGILLGNLVTYDTTGDLISTFTQSGKAETPIFSHDDTYLYFIETTTDQVTIKRISLASGQEELVFQKPVTGAITNLSLAPNDQQLIFTLIYQTVPYDPEEHPTPDQVRQDLYLLDLTTKNATVFLPNAYQADWGL